MTAPICLEKSANLLKCCTMKKVKLYHKQLSVFYRNEYTRVCVFGVCKACLTPFILIHLQFLPPQSGTDSYLPATMWISCCL